MIEIKDIESKMFFVAEDGKKFEDYSEYKEHQFELNLRKLEAISKYAWIDKAIAWIFLAVFTAGYLFGWFCNLTN